MKLLMQSVKDLSHEEIYFVFCMLRKYAGLPDPTYKNGNGRKNSRRKQPVKFKPNGKPNLLDLNCDSWNGCTEENFLIYKAIMEKIIIND